MPRVYPMGHRRRGAGLTTDSFYDIMRAAVLSQFAGQTWYVNSAAAAGGSGTSFTDAFQTLNAANAAALPGDTVIVAAGHAEVCIAAGTITLSKANVTYVGLGFGTRRPTITFTTATTATFAITGSGITIQNFLFDAAAGALDAVASPITVAGVNDTTFVGCEFFTGNATAQAGVMILVSGNANRFKMYDCTVRGSADAGTTNAIQIVGAASNGDGHEFVGCTFIGNYTTTLGAINNITVALTNILIIDCVFFNRTASSTKNIVLLTGSTGLIARNTLGVLSGAAPVTADGCAITGNFTSLVAGGGTISTIL